MGREILFIFFFFYLFYGSLKINSLKYLSNLLLSRNAAILYYVEELPTHTDCVVYQCVLC